MVKAYLGGNQYGEQVFLPWTPSSRRFHNRSGCCSAARIWPGRPRFRERFVAKFPNGSFELVEGAGHMLWWDDPERVGHSIGTFLAGT